jgi:hypothetical protein
MGMKLKSVIMSDLWFVFRLSSRHSLMIHATAITFLFNSSADRIALESNFRSDWPQASYSDWTMRFICVHVLLRSFENILGSCSEVRVSIRMKVLWSEGFYIAEASTAR